MQRLRRRNPRGQMSDAFPTMIFLTVSGGFQDAYTYFIRGNVFANAQTGNVVLMSERLFRGEWSAGMRYLIPLLAFTLGVWVAERVRHRSRYRKGMHWRQLVLICEVLMLVVVGLIPVTLNEVANAMVSFVCAMQVQAFRKLNGNAFASTMCIGNLRSGVEALDAYTRTRESAHLQKSLQYGASLLCFALGAGLGSVLTPLMGIRAIWVSCALLLASFGLMFLREETQTSE